MFCLKEENEVKYYRTDSRLIYSLPCSPLILETKGKGISSCNKILLFTLVSSPHGPNKVVLDPSCTWIRCTRVSSWYSNGPFNSNLVETFKTNALNVSFNSFVLDRVIEPFGTCNGSLLVFLGWFTSSPLSSKGFDLESKFVSNNVRSATLKVILYALSLILSKTWNEPSPRGCNFDFLLLGNRSLQVVMRASWSHGHATHTQRH